MPPLLNKMRKPNNIPIENYDYPLPPERIAKYPLADRDASKILVYRPGTNPAKKAVDKPELSGQDLSGQDLSGQDLHEPELHEPDLHEQRLHYQKLHDQELPGHKPLPRDPELHEQELHEPDLHEQELPGHKPLSRDPESPEKKRDSGAAKLLEEKQFCQVPELLEKSDRLYFNATRVVQARLVFRKSTGARIEIFCLEPYKPADYQLAFSSGGPVEFICLIGNLKKWKGGKLTRILEEMEKPDQAIHSSRATEVESEDKTAVPGEMSDPEIDKISEKPEASADKAAMASGKLILSAELAGRHDDKFVVRFSWNERGTSFGEILERSGSTPIPPYLNREAETRDTETYQTVYARQDGSVAAPTAGLHFTDRVLDALKRKGISRHELILHIGAGTFIPVNEENAIKHQMHTELVTVSRTLLESLLSGDRKIAVGTTTTRSLESIYWLGVRAISNEGFSFENLVLEQWDAYEMETEDTPHSPPMNKRENPVPFVKADRTPETKMVDPEYAGEAVRTNEAKTEDQEHAGEAVRTNEAKTEDQEHAGEANPISETKAVNPELTGKVVRTVLKETYDAVSLEAAVGKLLEKMDEAGLETFSFHTRLMIVPGYRFRVISGLFTNFHQPKSTLLLLIAAVAGDDWQKIYDFALENEFRFLSYGDSSLLFLQQAE